MLTRLDPILYDLRQLVRDSAKTMLGAEICCSQRLLEEADEMMEMCFASLTELHGRLGMSYSSWLSAGLNLASNAERREHNNCCMDHPYLISIQLVQAAIICSSEWYGDGGAVRDKLVVQALCRSKRQHRADQVEHCGIISTGCIEGLGRVKTT